MHHQVLDQRRQPAGLLRAGRRLVHDPVEGADHVAVDGLVRRAALDGVEHGGTQRPHVAGGVGGRPAGHLGGQEPGGADQQPGLRERLVGLEPGDAEVAQLHQALRRDQDVARLHVTVHDPGLVRGGQRGRGLGDQGGGLVRGQRALPSYQLGEVLGLDVLHHQPVLAGLLDQVEDDHHVLVVEHRRDLRLAAHAIEVGLALAGLGGHLTLQQEVLSEPYLAHAAAPDLALEAVAVGNGGHGRKDRSRVSGGLHP